MKQVCNCTHFLFFLTIFFCISGYAAFDDHFQKCPNKVEGSQVQKVDFIYLINLEKRPERLAKTLSQLFPYNIVPYRFSAVYGMDLSTQALNDVGLQFQQEMEGDRWVNHFPRDGNGVLERDFLRPSCYGKTYFSQYMRKGAIGCTLSHLSILQDAYDSNYETIWVLEDDICVKKNPHILSTLIEKLDQVVGYNNWDILYTDNDLELPSEKDLEGSLWWLWRPDTFFNYAKYAKRTVLNDDFIQIGSRWRTHSMIIRRSGIQKILEYEKEHHMFIPYDHELALAPNIQLFMTRYPIVTNGESVSDIQNRD